MTVVSEDTQLLAPISDRSGVAELLPGENKTLGTGLLECGVASSLTVSEARLNAPPALTSDATSSAQVQKPSHTIRYSGAPLRHKVPPALVPADDAGADGPEAIEHLTATTLTTQQVKPDKPDISVLASAVAASKLGLVEQLSQALASCAAVTFAKDAEDRTCLHYAAGYGHEECVSLLLEARGDTRVRDSNGDLPLHFAAIHGHPMCAYNITKACPAACLTRNYRGQTPVEVAVACERGEVLNAMLLACAGDGSGGTTVQAMRKLLSSGAVPDTWAPNGSSALMLAAAANGCEALRVLLEAGASLELQDALGRSALMFAAGNCAVDTLLALLDHGACISQRDRRGRNVLDYAPAGSEVRRLLQARLDELEAVANKRQEALLASLSAGQTATAVAGGDAKAAPGGKKKKQSAAKKAAAKGGGGTAEGAQASKAAKAQLPATNSPADAADLDVAGPAPGRAAFSGASSPPASPRGAAGHSQQAGAAAPAVEAPAHACQGERRLADEWGISGGDNAWKTVSSHKCAAKQRQQPPHASSEHCAASASSAAARSSGRPHAGVVALVASTASSHSPALSAARPSAAAVVARPPAAARTSQPGQGQARAAQRTSAAKPEAAGTPASAPTAAAAPTGGFKAALLGVDAIPTMAVGGQRACSPVAARPEHDAGTGLGLPISLASVATAPSTTERKPAWGGVKPVSTQAAGGCSPRSYPPLGATPAAPQPSPQVTPTRAAQPPSRQQEQHRAPAPAPAAPLAGSYATSSSVAAASVPPSVASMSESEATSEGTGRSSCSRSGDGACSPRSFGHDWTRPSPVDVLLQAALAASASNGDADKRSCHSKCSSSTLSYDGGASAPPPVAAPPAQPLSGQSLSELGGTEVPPPRRRSGGSAGGPGVEPSALDLVARTTQGQSYASCAAGAAGGGPASGGAASRGGGRSARAASGSSVSYMSEVARLKTDAECLQSRLRQVEQRHAQELAAVLMDAEAHEMAAVETAVAQERLRITANLLAIGLCPEAILAVITPPGHGLDAQHLLAATVAADCAAAAAAPPVVLAGLGDVAAIAAAAASTCGGSTPRLGRAADNVAAAVVPSATAEAGQPSGRHRNTAGGRGSAASGAGARGDSWGDSKPAGNGSASRSQRESSAEAAYSAQETGADADFLPAAPFGSLIAAPSAAIAIPSSASATVGCAAAAGSFGSCVNGRGGAANSGSPATAPALASLSTPACISLLGSPGTGVSLSGSFGSGGVVSSLCAGLGLGMIGAEVPGASCGCGAGSGPGGLVTRSGVGLGLLASAAVATEDEGEDDDEMDLPACGDISALLAMSDDDDA